MKRIAALLVALFPVITIPAIACSISMSCAKDSQEMRSAFTLQITHETRPVAGVTTTIENFDGNPIQAITANDGNVHIGPLSPGTYWIRAGSQYLSCFHVNKHASRKAKESLALDWTLGPIVTARVAGRFVNTHLANTGETAIARVLHPQYEDTAIAKSKLKLYNVSGSVLEVTTDENGRFDFGELREGIYVLHVERATVESGGYFHPDDDYLITVDDYSRNKSVVLRYSTVTSCSDMRLEMEKQPS